jgi:hypothetical protein
MFETSATALCGTTGTKFKLTYRGKQVVFTHVCREPVDGAKHPIPQVVYKWRISKISAIHFSPGVNSSSG